MTKKRKAFFSFYRSFQKELVFFIPALLTKMFHSLSIILINIHIPAVKPAATIIIVIRGKSVVFADRDPAAAATSSSVRRTSADGRDESNRKRGTTSFLLEML